MDQALALTSDLALSGVKPEYMDVRPLDTPERGAANIPMHVQGYAIPYWDISGKRTGFYRVRTFDYQPKYKQPKNTSNYVYFPKNFKEVVNGHPYILLTEGEKKAAAASAAGIPAVALGGVDSWRNKTTVLPEGTELKAGKKQGEIIVKTPDGARIDEGAYAKGFEDLVNFCIDKDLAIIICYDTDGDIKGINYDVQRAAAVLGYELRFMGLPATRVRQLILPSLPDTIKTGLDDYIVHNDGGASKLEGLISTVLSRRTAFPLHPNVREFVNRKLDRAKLDRKEAQGVSLAVLSDLDAKGVRYRSVTGDKMYYFDESSRALMKATIAGAAREQLLEAEFSRLLYKRYGLSAADSKVLVWLAAQFSAEEPVQTVSPHRVVYAERTSNVVRYQINDGQYACITSDPARPYTVHDNGYAGILFESGLDNPIESSALEVEVTRQRKLRATSNAEGDASLPCWWAEVLSDTRLKNKADPNAIRFSALLYYISPWLFRWKGTQLPVELIIGEAGSGKSTLCSLRMQVLVGSQLLRNSPSDLKDWQASVTNSGGLHVIDNVHFVDKNLRQRMSDEICRLVTEPSPHIEMRKYYTHADLVRIPVEAAFALTAIKQPFPNADLIARAVIIELDKEPYTNAPDQTEATTEIDYATAWMEHHLDHPERKGRPGWIAHHILVLNRFFQIVEQEWDPSYRAKHRLINLEQAMVMMAKVFGWDTDWVRPYLAGTVVRQISDADWTLEGLNEWANTMRGLHKGRLGNTFFSSSDIAAWATADEDYKDCYQLVNSRKLGRYLVANKALIHSVVGLQESGTRNNKVVYRVAQAPGTNINAPKSGAAK